MNSKKIAIVVSHPIQHFCPMYASWASKEGIELKVFFGSNLGSVKYIDTNFKKEIQWSNLYLDSFNHEFLNGNKTLEPTPKLDALNLEQKLNEFRPNVLIYYGYFHQLSKRARNWAIKNKVKTGYISDAEHRQKRPLWKEIVKYPFLFFFFKKIDYFLTVGDANEVYYAFYGVPKDKMSRMHFSIDIKSYEKAFSQKQAIRESFRKKLDITEKNYVISVVGKLVDWKSQHHLIQLLHNLELSHPSKTFHLLIAGSGPMEDQWKLMSRNLKSNKVHFLGFVQPTDLPEVYAAADVYIHPALIEPHSLSISEAIYMGCPVIVAHTSGSWGADDDVQIGKNGYVYQHGNLNELQQQLLQVIDDNKFETFSKTSVEISRKFQQQSHFGILKQI